MNIINIKVMYDYLKGLNKKDVKKVLGQAFNDMNSDIWSYRLTEKFSLFRKNHLYIKFRNGIVCNYELKTFKIDPYKKNTFN